MGGEGARCHTQDMGEVGNYLRFPCCVSTHPTFYSGPFDFRGRLLPAPLLALLCLVCAENPAGLGCFY